MGSILYHFPTVIVSFMICTVVITFYLSYVHYGHVTYLLPYISDTGTYPPESCIFGQSLNIVSVMVGFALYLKYLQVKEMLKKHHIGEKYKLNKTALIVGLFSSTGVSLVANFQETNAFTVHWLAAIMTFGGGSLYMCLQTYLYTKLSPVIGQRKTTMFRIVLAVIALISFVVSTVAAFLAYGQFRGNDMTKWKEEDGGYHVHQISTNAEWICATCVLIYIILFQGEFKNIVVKPMKIVLDEQNNTQ